MVDPLVWTKCSDPTLLPQANPFAFALVGWSTSGRGTILACTALIVTGCGTGAQEYVDAGPALDQVRSVVHDFAVANEWHYSESTTYTGDFSQLQRWVDWTEADSVELTIVEVGAHGYAVLGTHIRLGEGIGCAFAWGRPEASVSTPGGVPFRGGNQILCDEVPSREDN